ncbi:MAG: cell division protease FtsH, partial [Frankiaceae bacterium]|nr:cell division protease FtsH [Frankiaceae bacterium]
MPAQERRTRKPLGFWDRSKFLILLTLLWFVLVWAAMADNALLPFGDAARLQVRSSAWILVLGAVEAVRQIHFFISEHSARYHGFWTNRVFGGFDRLTRRRLSDWTRYRMGRALKWAFWISVLSVV